MKINKLIDIDLSNYVIAYAYTNIMDDSNICQDDVMAIAQSGKSRKRVTIALIPKHTSLLQCSGDDWDDVPAECNASGFYEYPEGTIFLEGNLGQELELRNEKHVHIGK